MEKVDANLYIEVLCACPYCGAAEDIFDKDSVKEPLGDDHAVTNCDIEIVCSECNKEFIVENIHF